MPYPAGRPSSDGADREHDEHERASQRSSARYWGFRVRVASMPIAVTLTTSQPRPSRSIISLQKSTADRPFWRILHTAGCIAIPSKGQTSLEWARKPGKWCGSFIPVKTYGKSTLPEMAHGYSVVPRSAESPLPCWRSMLLTACRFGRPSSLRVYSHHKRGGVQGLGQLARHPRLGSGAHRALARLPLGAGQQGPTRTRYPDNFQSCAISATISI